ncbi:hypothetical protein QWZ13_10145 [Reinekea marina]|uniref:hypothetical protein n=1 Tax=Reinekea marina TaxID=1310421 RepID=UPI0025B47F58|nr:hypothetical protein [Reinekea marina]MDN3649273.1 hypothetical protein [Reinekea marina]
MDISARSHSHKDIRTERLGAFNWLNRINLPPRRQKNISACEISCMNIQYNLPLNNARDDNEL